MGLHQLHQVTMGVPNVDATAAYYAEFGLASDVHSGPRTFSTTEGGEQLRIVSAPSRRLIELVVGADDQDDLDRVLGCLATLGLAGRRAEDSVTVDEPIAGFTAVVKVLPRLEQVRVETTPYNGPGRVDRGGRAPGVLREGGIRPKKLGHAVIGSTDMEATRRFFVDGLGFQVSDFIKGHGAFMRCSTDHHNVLVLRAPVNFLHHTSWQVDDIDEVGRGASRMLEGHPERHVWGLGRHHGGSNFFWYLKDPAGNFSEYYSDMDCIPEDSLWTPEDLDGAKGLYSWGPPPPPSFLAPEDLAALMTGSHSA